MFHSKDYKTMKKTYIKPETTTVLMNVERLICTSGLKVMRGGSESAATDPNDVEDGIVMGARRRNTFGLDYDRDLW